MHSLTRVGVLSPTNLPNYPSNRPFTYPFATRSTTLPSHIDPSTHAPYRPILPPDEVITKPAPIPSQRPPCLRAAAKRSMAPGSRRSIGSLMAFAHTALSSRGEAWTRAWGASRVGIRGFEKLDLYPFMYSAVLRILNSLSKRLWETSKCSRRLGLGLPLGERLAVSCDLVRTQSEEGLSAKETRALWRVACSFKGKHQRRRSRIAPALSTFIPGFESLSLPSLPARRFTASVELPAAPLVAAAPSVPFCLLPFSTARPSSEGNLKQSQG